MGADQDDAERELESVIRAIAEDEPVTLLTPPNQVGEATCRRFGPDVEIVPAPVDDIWMRDIAPVFAKRGSETIAIDLNFNTWDGSRRPRPGDRLARIFDFGVPVIGTTFVGEGGALLTNGRGLAIATRSCLLSRNPHLDETALTKELTQLGIHTVVWLDGDRSEPITTGHPDGFLALLPDGGVVVETIVAGRGSRWRAGDVAMLQRAVSAGCLGRVVKFDARPIRPHPEIDGSLFAATYLNLFITRKTVLTASLGDSAQDLGAAQQLGKLFPDRSIRMLGIDTILGGGGGIRCLTQTIPD